MYLHKDKEAFKEYDDAIQTLETLAQSKFFL